MKKIISILIITMVPALLLANNTAVFGQTGDAINETGTMVGSFLFLAVSAIWLLPIVFGIMVYSGQKKKAEQQHEEVGMKAALYALVAIIIGAAASYYVVGTIGDLSNGDTQNGLDAGNSYFLKTFFDSGTVALGGTVK